ncbi:hypothetical protein GCM10009744_59810 [Kribbella alba]|uniref:Uncharacterized protein n=1 Tax=Kribbella alba TaxID=190197 RepID=A0ABN2FTJ4_9ACTN
MQAQQVLGERGREAGELPFRAQVEDAAHPGPPDHLDAFGGQELQAVRTDQGAVADPPTIRRRQPADIADVATVGPVELRAHRILQRVGSPRSSLVEGPQSRTTPSGMAAPSELIRA